MYKVVARSGRLFSFVVKRGGDSGGLCIVT